MSTFALPWMRGPYDDELLYDEYTEVAVLRPRPGLHRPETLGRHAITVHQIRANAAIADMHRLTQDGRADLQVVRA